MDTPVQPPVPPSSNTPVPTQRWHITFTKRKLWMGIGIGMFLILGISGFFLWQSMTKTPEKNTTGKPIETKKPDTAIAKVGDEYIYQKDLNTEIANYPMPVDDAVRKRLLEKIVKDSIILQAAKKENLTKLDPAVYNSPNKNYAKRVADIQSVEKNIDGKVAQISGSMITVWFYNTYPAKIGLVEGKKEALKRITALHKRVASKEITMQEAANLIRTDPSYEDIDFGYTNNALITFSQNKGERISVNVDFDKLIWKTKPGEVTPIFLAKDIVPTTMKTEEAFYAFAQVDKKIDTSSTKDFATWYTDQKNNYEVTYY